MRRSGTKVGDLEKKGTKKSERGGGTILRGASETISFAAASKTRALRLHGGKVDGGGGGRTASSTRAARRLIAESSGWQDRGTCHAIRE